MIRSPRHKSARVIVWRIIKTIFICKARIALSLFTESSSAQAKEFTTGSVEKFANTDMTHGSKDSKSSLTRDKETYINIYGTACNTSHN